MPFPLKLPAEKEFTARSTLAEPWTHSHHDPLSPLCNQRATNPSTETSY